VEIRVKEDIGVAEIVPRFDAYSAKDVESALNATIDGGTTKIICDFSKTDYISSAGLRVLLATAKKLQRLGGAIVLCALRPPVREVFETAGFTQLFQILDSEADAGAALA